MLKITCELLTDSWIIENEVRTIIYNNDPLDKNLCLSLSLTHFRLLSISLYNSHNYIYLICYKNLSFLLFHIYMYTCVHMFVKIPIAIKYIRNNAI